MVFLLEGPPEERVFFGVHATIGAEFRQDSFGYFVEVHPSIAFVGYVQPYLRTRVGLNYYF